MSGNDTYRRADRVRRLGRTEEFTVYETVGGISVSGTARPTRQQLPCSGNATYRRADRGRRLRHTEEFSV